MSQILGVKFNDFGQIYYFSSGPFVVREGHSVIVKTEQGMGLGKVFVIQQELPEEISEDSLKTIYRLAGEEDLEADRENRELSRNALKFCKNCIDKQKLEMKLVDVEVFFDRSKMIFYFTAPGRIDFRELVKELVKEYRTRIELRQIGVRHETQMLGAIGNCGQICCCRRFMRKFMPVTIRMAKEQNLFLNPTKISGICGRLLCCLSFEQDNYEEFHRKCPKIGKRYNTIHGSVRVTRTNFFRNALTVLPEEGDEIEISLDEWPDVLRQSNQSRPAQPESRDRAPRREAGNAQRPQSPDAFDRKAERPLNTRPEKGNRKGPDKSSTGPDQEDRPRLERSGGEKTGLERRRPERPTPDKSRSDRPKPERSRPERKKRPLKHPDKLRKQEQDKNVPVTEGEQKVEQDSAEKQNRKTSKKRRPSRRRRRKKPSGNRKN